MVTPVYSIAKIFTAAAVLRRFDPGRRIGEVVSTPARLSRLTVGDLLTHRSGLGDYGRWPEYRDAVAAREVAWPDEVILERVELAEPGVFRYANPGYLLLRRALEESAGADFFTVLDTTVLAPLEIPARPFADRADWDHCTVPISERLREYDPRWVYTGTFCADVADTAAGLARLLGGALGHDLPTAMRVTHPVEAPGHAFAEPGYGSGLMTDGFPPSIVGHGGGGPGFELFAAARADGSAAVGVCRRDDAVGDPARECVAGLRGAGASRREGEMFPRAEE